MTGFLSFLDDRSLRHVAVIKMGIKSVSEASLGIWMIDLKNEEALNLATETVYTAYELGVNFLIV